MEHRFISTDGALVIGADARIDDVATGAVGVAIGPEATLAGHQGVAVGASTAAGAGGVAVGDHAETGGIDSVAIGDGAGASADYQVGIGAGVGLGTDSPGAVAIGRLADAKADAVAVGRGALALGADAIAIGRSVEAAAGEIVIGRPDTIARFGGDFALPVVADPPSGDPGRVGVIRLCTGNGAVYVWTGSSWALIG
ncbi:MAG: hypothetical protein DYG90_08875 [Chloroflexi bacterium CFX6]|nr:hypothetical protein [Chloroflexi bacterium CFX6]